MTVKDLAALEVLRSANVEATCIEADRSALTISVAGNAKVDAATGTAAFDYASSLLKGEP